MSEPLWTARQAMAATGGILAGDTGWTCSGISIDSRTIQPGDLFIALKDERDGHDYAAAAMRAGAAACLISRGDLALEPALQVKDTLSALRSLGEAARERCSAIRVAVTGSVGKTTVKDALAAVFRAAGPAHWSVKSYNNHWGVPLTLARMPRDTQRAVFEMGMNHAGEIRDLSSMVRPHVAMITRIAPAHLEHLGSIEAIADAKAEIFEGLETDGVAIYPADDPQAERLARHARHSGAAFMLDFGTAKDAAIRIESFETGLEGSRGIANVLGMRVPFSVKASGMHWAWNIAAIFAASAGAGLDAGDVAEALAGLEAGAGRGRVLTVAHPAGGSFTLLDDAYNANPVSMAAAISALGAAHPGKGGRRIAVLGDMLELGPDEAAMHAALAEPLEAAGVDQVYTCGSRMRSLHDALPAPRRAGYAANADEGLDLIRAAIRPGDVVLVKGSNASGLHRIAASLADGSALGLTEA
ncbi:MAG: UDP-N-acetylmuramoyl-tripeptide--D-alanyl-D-alanine ligase [Pseudomonadota bacterium]|nr:UDP-N-acetylmuramoyl-tripeptide--D-alanyl-D-alanine ligase [Pseudomonadota bacterium]